MVNLPDVPFYNDSVPDKIEGHFIIHLKYERSESIGMVEFFIFSTRNGRPFTITGYRLDSNGFTLIANVCYHIEYNAMVGATQPFKPYTIIKCTGVK